MIKSKLLLMVALISLLLVSCSQLGSLQNGSNIKTTPELKLDSQALHHLVKGAFLESLNEPRRAVYEYNLALLHDSTSVEIRRALAENYLLLGEYESFVVHAQALLRSEPDNRKLRARLAFVYHYLGDLSATNIEIKRLLQDMPEGEKRDPEIGEEVLLSLLLELQIARADSSEFMRLFHEFISKGYYPDPQFLEMYHAVIVEEAYHESEIEFLRKQIDSPQTPFYLELMLVDLLLSAERLSDAETAITAACQRNEQLIESWYSLSIFQRYRLEDPDRARRTLLEGVNRFPAGGTLLLELSDLEEEAGNLELAEQFLLDLIAVSKDIGTGDLYLSDFYMRHPVFRAKAIALYQQLLLEEKLEDPTLMNNYAYLVVEDSTDVSAALLQEVLLLSDQSLEIQPENPSFLDTNGWIHFRLGNIEQARAQLRLAMRYDAQQPVILEHLATVLEQDDPEESLLLRRRAQEFRRLMENDD
jgi:tetratricopeptide (TPR) repeat protein